MKTVKIFLFKLIVIYVIAYLTFACFSQCLAVGYNEACGEYVSEYAKKFATQYGSSSVYDVGTRYPYWTGGSIGSGTFHVCCTTGVWYVYKQALGIDLYSYDYNSYSDSDMYLGNSSSNWETVPLNTSSLQAGDIVVKYGHVELYVGNGENVNFGSVTSGGACKYPSYNTYANFSYAMRLSSSVQVYPTGTIASTNSSYDEEQDSIYGSNGFIYQGTATLSGYQSGGTLGKWLFDTLLDILDWIIGLMTYVIRIVIVGWTTIIERFVIDGLVNWVTGINNSSDDTTN